MTGPPLVIATGNPLRSDDGAGPAVAARLGANGWGVLVLHQLGPELCEEVAAASAVLFVDARRASPAGAVTLTPLAPGAPAERGAAGMTHAVAPEVVLAGAERLCGRRPPAALLTVNGADFGLGERLSAEVEAALPRAVAEAERFLAGAPHPSPLPARSARGARE